MTHPILLLKMKPFSYCTLSLCTVQPSPHTADATVLVLHTADVTFLILQTFSSQHTPCPPTEDVTFLILYTLSLCIAQPSPRSVDATFLVLHTFTPSTAGVTFLILLSFSSHYTPSPPTSDVAILVLYTFSSYCITFSSYYRCDPPGTAHILSLYCIYDILHNADFPSDHTPCPPLQMKHF